LNEFWSHEGILKEGDFLGALAVLGIYFGIPSEETTHMPDGLRITVDEVRKRMEAGEDFVLVDTRNPQAWSQSDVKLPEAIRLPLENLDEDLSKIPRAKPVVAYCT
jgi:hypothetical protein